MHSTPSTLRYRRTVYLASPLSGDVEANQHYARRCMIDSLSRGEAPFVPHLLYPQVLDDTRPEDRALGMEAGTAWLWQARALVAYVDLGVSAGMAAEIAEAERLGLPVERREIGR
jgi:hypothetical protein